MALIIAPLVILGAVVKIVQQHDYPAGDVRNEPLFWMATGTFFFLIGGVVLIGAIRELRRGKPHAPSPSSRDIPRR
jgi:hypothetical protein